MGGSFAPLLLQRRNIHIDHIFIGSSDMDQASPFVARIETALIWKMMSGFAKDPEKSIAKMKKRMAKKNMSIGTTPDGKEADGTFMLSIMEGLIANIQKIDPKTGKNQFYADLVTKVDDHIEVADSTVHVFYAEEMGEKYLKRYRQHFANPDIISFPCGHEG